MATWQVRARISVPGLEADSAEAAAIATIQAQLAAQLPGWTIEEVLVRPSFQVDEWVIANKAPTVREYARIVQGQTDLQVEFADGTRRGLNQVVSRV